MSKKNDLPIEAMERLAQVMNDSPTIVKMNNTEFKITALKAGTQMLIAEESVKIQKSEQGNFNDLIKQFSLNTPSVVKIITLAILNDKDRIYKKDTKEFSDEYYAMYETIMWETEPKYWLNLLVEIMQLLSLDFFFDTTNAIAMIREMALGRKMTMEEQKSLLAERNTGK